MVPYELTTYADVVNKALIIEREVNAERMKGKEDKEREQDQMIYKGRIIKTSKDQLRKQ